MMCVMCSNLVSPGVGQWGNEKDALPSTGELGHTGPGSGADYVYWTLLLACVSAIRAAQTSV